MHFDFTDQVVVVTGAASGMGRGAAIRFLRLGANVWALDLDDDGLARLKAESRGAPLHTLCADVARPEQWQPMLAGLPNIDVLCNAAAIVDPGEPDIDALLSRADSAAGLERVSADLQRVFATNHAGPCLLSLFAAGKMKARYTATAGKAQRNGVIINVGSTNVFTLNRRRFAYAPLKAALHSLTQWMAKELAPYGIRVNAVVPGATAGTLIVSDPELAAQRMPLGINQLDDVVDAMVFLASGHARNVTGVLFTVDGGRCVAAT